MSLILDYSDFRLQQGRAITMPQHTKEGDTGGEEKPQIAKMVRRFFLFVSVILVTYYRNPSPLRHGRNYPTGHNTNNPC
jgi:hypothetical protein